MGRLGIFLHRRQIALLRRLLVAAELPDDPEMRDLRREIDHAYELVEGDRRNQWGGNYEWTKPNSTRREVTDGIQ